MSVWVASWRYDPSTYLRSDGRPTVTLAHARMFTSQEACQEWINGDDDRYLVRQVQVSTEHKVQVVEVRLDEAELLLQLDTVTRQYVLGDRTKFVQMVGILKAIDAIRGEEP